MPAGSDERKQQHDRVSGSWVVIDQAEFKRRQQELRANQNMSLALLAGLGAAILGAGVWAMITALTGYQIGFMAVGVGFLVGSAVRRFGKGIDVSFGIVGAALALFGCLLGNLLAACIAVCRQEQIGFLYLLLRLAPAAVADLMKIAFSPMDVLFYGIAIYEGFKFSLRRIPPHSDPWE